jgi:hypothetical protein
VPLLFDDAELGAYRLITRIIRQIRENLADGGPLTPVEYIHDLALAPRELC